MKDSLTGVKLGQAQAYVEHYDPTLLVALPRARPDTQVHGLDIWTAYELSWLAPGGKPEIAIAEFRVPATSPNLIESKSFKYYLNSFNQTEIASAEELQGILVRDLSLAAGAAVETRLFGLDEFMQYRSRKGVHAVLLDSLPLRNLDSAPRPERLQVAEGRFDDVWCSHLLKSNCPVTGQPDWASLWIGWRGPALVPEDLLAYVVSYRQHRDFHEHCVERIFADLLAAGRPEDLWVYARYTRRGGLDINPFRSLCSMAPPVVTAARQ